MKSVKIVLSLVLSMIIAFGCLTMASAGNVAEGTADNDTYANATDLSTVSNTGSGDLSSITDVDWYKFTTTNMGILKISLSQSAGSGDANLFKVTVLDIDGGTEKVYGTFSVKDNNSSVSAQYTIPAGTHYIKVTAGGSWFEARTYNIGLSLNTSGNFEVEDNNSSSTANAIALSNNANSKTYIGSVSSGDKDYFSVYMAAAGYIQPIVKNTTATGALTVNVFDTSSVNAADILIESFSAEQEVETQGSFVYVDKGTYYIEVEGASDSVSASYEIFVYSNINASCEKEYNDTMATATRLDAGKTCYGNNAFSEDMDYFKLDLSKSKDYTIVLDTTSSQKNGSWVYQVVDASGQAVKTGNFYYGAAKTETLTGLEGAYYLVIYSDSYLDDNYKITVSAKDAETTEETDWFQSVKDYLWKFWLQFDELIGKLDLLTMGSKMLTQFVTLLVNLGINK